MQHLSFQWPGAIQPQRNPDGNPGAFETFEWVGAIQPHDAEIGPWLRNERSPNVYEAYRGAVQPGETNGAAAGVNEYQAWRGAVQPYGTPTATLSGSILTATSAQIQAGGLQAVITLNGATWNTFDGTVEQAIIDGVAGIFSDSFEGSKFAPGWIELPYPSYIKPPDPASGKITALADTSATWIWERPGQLGLPANHFAEMELIDSAIEDNGWPTPFPMVRMNALGLDHTSSTNVFNTQGFYSYQYVYFGDLWQELAQWNPDQTFPSVGTGAWTPLLSPDANLDDGTIMGLQAFGNVIEPYTVVDGTRVETGEEPTDATYNTNTQVGFGWDHYPDAAGALAIAKFRCGRVGSSTQWNRVARDALTITDVVRTSDTVVTVTLPPMPAYGGTADEIDHFIVVNTEATNTNSDVGPIVTGNFTITYDPGVSNSGGYGGWNWYDAYAKRREKERKRLAMIRAELDKLDGVDRQIADLMYADQKSEARDAQIAELERLIATNFNEQARAAARAYNERVEKAMIRAVEQRNYSAIAAFERELDRAMEDEEFLFMAFMLLD